MGEGVGKPITIGEDMPDDGPVTMGDGKPEEDGPGIAGDCTPLEIGENMPGRRSPGKGEYAFENMSCLAPWSSMACHCASRPGHGTSLCRATTACVRRLESSLSSGVKLAKQTSVWLRKRC